MRLTPEGDLVSRGGRPIVWETRTNQIQPTGAELSIDSAGYVFQGNEEIGKLRLVDFQDRKGLKQDDKGYFHAPQGMTEDPATAVIYSGTYSKPFATGIRVGFGLAPEDLFPAIMRIKGNHDFGTSNLPQQILREALASGVYESHVQALRARYGIKARAMLGALRLHCADVAEWTEPRGGLNVWAKFPR